MATVREMVDNYRTRGNPTEAPDTVKSVARRARISRQYLYDVMAGRYAPSPHIVLRLANVLGVSAKTLNRALQELHQ